jgi:nitrate/nitrite-specific signal transduction histidine kinase
MPELDTVRTVAMNSDELELRRLKWIAILVPLAFLFAVELVRSLTSPRVFDAWPGYILITGIVLLGTLSFSEALFSIIGRMQLRLTRQNLELLALHEAGIAITSELDLDRVLQRIVDQARELGVARYGALSLLKEDGGIESFLTSGISRDEREAIGPLPVGHGLLGAVIDEGRALRIPDLTRDPRSYGFPENHPPMYSLLAVPILSRDRILGSLYLTEKQNGDEFDKDDQRRLERFATQCAIAIENAHLHQQVWALAVTQERERIAREMHDSIAQVLGYVNTKAQAAQELLGAGQPHKAEAQIAQLSEAAREAYSDVRENILGLRTSPNAGAGLMETLKAYLER